MQGKSLVALFLVAAIAAAGGYFYGGKTTGPASGNTDQATAKERKILYWYDPMVPSQHFDKPGKSPFMDMQLVPMYDDAQAPAGGVAVNPRTIQSMGVRTVPATRGDLVRRINTVGYIQPDEHKIEVVQSRAAGWVEVLHIKTANDPVRKNQLLLELYSPDLLSAQDEFFLAQHSLHGQETDFALLRAAREKLALLGLSEQQIRQIEAEGKPRRRVAFYAPINGIVGELGVRQGSQVSPGMTLFSLVDLSTVWLTAEIPETEGGWVHTGNQAEIRIPAFPGKQYQGKVAYVYPKITAATRTLQVRLRLDNPGTLLKPGMFARVTLMDEAKRNALLVPSEAVIANGSRNVVIVAEGEGKFHPVEVQTGEEAAGQTEILSGLNEGQAVVASGQFMLDSESNLKTSLERMKPGESSQPAKPAVHTGRGKIHSIDPVEGSLNMTHDPILSLKWPAMTMDFVVKDKTLLKDLHPGQTVAFELAEVAPGEFTITRFMPTK